MKTKKILKTMLITLFFISCGETTVKIKEPKKPIKASISGEVYNYIIIKMEFITDIKQLCTDLYLPSDFASEELYNQQVSECTFDKLSIINLDALNDFNTNICDNPQTQDEIAICDALN